MEKTYFVDNLIKPAHQERISFWEPFPVANAREEWIFSQAERMRPLSEVKILVVDDEPLVTTLINQILSTEGYIVLECNSAKEGLEVFKKERPDLTLLDIGMPDMDGYEFCEKLKELDTSQTPAVVFLSGRSEEEDAGRSFDVGAFSYIRKPFSNASLKQLVNLAISSLR